MKHKIVVANAVHDWTSAHDEWIKKQELGRSCFFPIKSAWSPLGKSQCHGQNLVIAMI